MKFLKILSIALLAGVLMACPLSYAGNTLNISHVNTTYNYDNPIANAVLDDSASGVSITYGYGISPNFSIDADYTDFGEATRSFGFITTTAEATSISLMGHFNATLGTVAGHDIKGHITAGLTQGDATVSVNGFSVSDKDTGLKYGAGLSLSIDHHWAVTAMYTKSDLDFNVGGTDVAYDPETMEIGVSYNF